MKYMLLTTLAVFSFFTVEHANAADIDVKGYDQLYSQYRDAVLKSAELARKRLDETPIYNRDQKRRYKQMVSYFSDILADTSGGRFRNSTCGDVYRQTLGEHVYLHDRVSSAIFLSVSSCKGEVFTSTYAYELKSLQNEIEKEFPLHVYLKKLSAVYEKRQKVGSAGDDIIRTREVVDYNAAQIESIANDINKEIAERKANEKLSCGEIGKKASAILKENILSAATAISGESQEYEHQYSYECRGRYVGRVCGKYVELDGCTDYYEPATCYASEMATRTVYFGDYSDKCYKSDAKYEALINGLKNKYEIKDYRKDVESEKALTQLRSNVSEFLTKNKFYINISESKLQSCRAQINEAIKQNVRNECYSNLIQKDWNASIFETRSLLVEKSKEVKSIGSRMRARGSSGAAN